MIYSELVSFLRLGGRRSLADLSTIHGHMGKTLLSAFLAMCHAWRHFYFFKKNSEPGLVHVLDNPAWALKGTAALRIDIQQGAGGRKLEARVRSCSGNSFAKLLIGINDQRMFNICLAFPDFLPQSCIATEFPG